MCIPLFQIEVTFDIDANGILNVTASENASGKKNQITINNDKGRLSKEQIDRMIEEADRYKEQDEQIKAAIAAKNDLETYVYQVKSMVSGKWKVESWWENGKLALGSVLF